jgi:hypothetical protein
MVCRGGEDSPADPVGTGWSAESTFVGALALAAATAATPCVRAPVPARVAAFRKPRRSTSAP